jgi:sugar phosphate isomerase/epimerase
MKVSMMSYTMARGPWGKNPDVRDLCEFTRELGLEGIDWVTTHGLAPAEIRKVTDQFGLRNVCYTFYADVQHPPGERRSRARDHLFAGLDAARALGAEKVMIPLPGLKGLARDETRRLALEGLREAASLGRQAAITVTIEPFPGADSPFVTSDDLLQAVAAAPGLKITFDNGNVLTAGEEPAAAFRKLKDHVVHAHLKDWELADDGARGLDGRRYKGALVGEGIVDPRPCVQAMAEAGYDGYINFEYEGSLYDPRGATVRGVALMKDLIREASAPDRSASAR